MQRREFARRLAGSLLLGAAGCGEPARVKEPPRPRRILLLTQTAGFRHDSIPLAAETVARLGAESGAWEVAERADTAAQVAAAVTAERLRQVDAVCFANTTGDLAFAPEGRRAFHEWVRAGGAYVGIHSASDTFHGDPDYLDLVRGEFLTHGPQREVAVVVQDPAHPACQGLPAAFPVVEEIYEFQHWHRARVHVLLAMRSHPQSGAPGDFPLAWTHRPGAGRMFYTALGHREDVWAGDAFQRHLAGGIRWALGLAPGDDTPGNPAV